MQALSLTEAELVAWLRLTTTPGISRGLARRLLATFGLPPEIFRASHAALRAAAGASAAVILQGEAPTDFALQVAATHAWLAQPGCQLLTLADPAYPPRLLETPDPPPLLYLQGRLALLHTPALAMVGSRHASAQGLANARAFASAFARAGLTVVSGLALGVDGAAH